MSGTSKHKERQLRAVFLLLGCCAFASAGCGKRDSNARDTSSVREAILGHWTRYHEAGYTDYYIDTDECFIVTKESASEFTYTVIASNASEKWIKLRLTDEDGRIREWHLP